MFDSSYLLLTLLEKTHMFKLTSSDFCHMFKWVTLYFNPTQLKIEGEVIYCPERLTAEQIRFFKDKQIKVTKVLPKASFRSRDCEGEDTVKKVASLQLTAMNFVGYNIRTEFVSDKSKKLTIIACPLKGTFKYEVVNESAFVYLGSSLEEAISEYNQV